MSKTSNKPSDDSKTSNKPSDDSKLGAFLRKLTVQEVHPTVNWNSLPMLDLTTEDKIDLWFVHFETKMTPTRIPRDRWIEAIIDCPKIDSSVKDIIHEGIGSYDEFRLRILKDHGPMDPTNYYKRALFRVKGSNREDIKAALDEILLKHNRAADDEDREKLKKKDLCYAFIEAFPSTIRNSLEQKMTLVVSQPEAFDQLYRLSPSRKDDTLMELQVTREKRAPTDSTQDLRDFARTLISEMKSTPYQRTPRNSFRRRQCMGCGKDCTNRAVCPAKDEICGHCGKRGHYARVCLKTNHPFRERPTSS